MTSCNGDVQCMILMQVAMVVVVVSVMMWPAEGRHLDDASRRPVSLAYHGGPLLTSPSLILHLFWYGSFSASQQAAIMDFISSFQAGSSSPAAGASTVASWWKGVSLYTDASHARASTLLKLGSTASNPSCSFGKGLTRAQISQLLEDSISTGLLPQHTNTDVIYIVFTSSDVVVESFCMSSCGYHSSVMSGQLPFIWVGNAERQCLGLCAWPFAVPQYGPRGRKALVPPSGDAATDGMIINLATLLAGAVTNPFGQGYFPDAVDANTMYTNGSSAPAARGNVEAATACAGMFGKDSYPGFPGTLLLDATSGAAYNAYGFNQRRFLLPALWSPTTTKCQPPPS